MTWLALLLTAVGAQADPPLAACRKDIRQFCIQVPNERLWLEKCLSKNLEQLSAECRASAGERITWLAQFADHCIHDRVKFCPKVPADKKMLVQCLNEPGKDLTPNCRDWIARE